MKKVLIILGLAAALAGTARAQTSTVQGYCQTGGVKVQTQGVHSTTTVQGSYPNCTVTVYQTGTGTLATLFSSAGGAALSNPFVAPTNGQWRFWASTSACYDVILTGGVPLALPSPQTYTDVCGGGGGGGGGGVTSWNTRIGAVTLTTADVTALGLLANSTSGNAATATALAGTPTLCSTGQAPTGILPNGNVTGCAAIGGGAVSSVFGRTGAVTAASGDYSSFYCLLTGCTMTGPLTAGGGTYQAGFPNSAGPSGLASGNQYLQAQTSDNKLHLYTGVTDEGSLCSAGNGACAAASNFSNYGGVNTYGDSITQGTGSSNFMAQGLLATGYAQDLIADFGGNGQNFGYGGDQAADMSLKVYSNANPAVIGNPITTMLISTNDVNVYGTNTDKQNIFQRALQGAIGWASIADIYKAYTKDTNFCARTGTWNSDSGAPRGGSIYTTNAGDFLSCSITVPAGGLAIYYSYTACDGYAPGAAQILIDGVSPGTDATLLSYGQGGAAIATSNGSTCTEFVARYPTTAGAHTFKITLAGGGGLIEPLWVGTPIIETGVPAPPIVFVGGTPWNEGNTPASTTSAYNTIISNIVASMHGDGAPVYFVDIRNGTNTANSNTTTPFNSTTDYDGGIEGDVTCPASAFNPYHPNSSAYWSRACGHGHLAANFETAIGIKAGGPSPNTTVGGAVLAPNGFPSGATNGYGASVNGDMRRGSLAGSYYNPSSDANMHYATPTAGGCHYFEMGNNPSPGVAPTIITPYQLCPTVETLNGPSISQTTTTFNSYTNTNTPATDTGYPGAVYLFPNLQLRSTGGVLVGRDLNQSNNASFKFIYFGNADPANAAWFGLVSTTGTFPGFCSAAAFIGIGYTENQSGGSGSFPCPTSGDPVQFRQAVTFHASVTTQSYNTLTNCASSASPAVCGSAASGSVAIATSGTTLTVNSSAVTANSQILLMGDSSLGSRLGITCATDGASFGPFNITARSAGTSFTITNANPDSTGQTCLNYTIVN